MILSKNGEAEIFSVSPMIFEKTLLKNNPENYVKVDDTIHNSLFTIYPHPSKTIVI